MNEALKSPQDAQNSAHHLRGMMDAYHALTGQHIDEEVS